MTPDDCLPQTDNASRRTASHNRRPSELSPGARASAAAAADLAGLPSAVTRRAFLAASAALAAGAQAARLRVARAAAPRTAAEIIPGKDPRLIVHGASPAEIETPLALLRQHRLTPKELLFVRNNQTYPGSLTLEPLPLAGWRIELTGLVDRPAAFDAAQLERLPRVEHEVVLQCSGNGRFYFSQEAPCDGAPWQAGSMANVMLAGVPLAEVLKWLEIAPQARARFVTAEGRDLPDKPGAADFEHSLPLEATLARSFLALSLNGQPLPAAHGGPVRLVTPGFYGTMQVKWLSRLRFESEETANHHQAGRYRTPKTPLEPGAPFDYALANSEPNWGMRTKSVIFEPLDGQALAAGPLAMAGVAFNDGLAPIIAVEVAVDDARAWTPAQFDPPQGPYGWYHWRAALALTPGEHLLRVRAIDALGRTQPLDGKAQWNPAGYCYSGVHAVRVTVKPQ